MIYLNKLTHDDQGMFREDRTKGIVHPEKIGDPKIVKIHRNYTDGLIYLTIWTLRNKTYPDANGYIPGEFQDVQDTEFRIAKIQFYKY